MSDSSTSGSRTHIHGLLKSVALPDWRTVQYPELDSNQHPPTFKIGRSTYWRTQALSPVPPHGQWSTADCVRACLPTIVLTCESKHPALQRPNDLIWFSHLHSGPHRNRTCAGQMPEPVSSRSRRTNIRLESKAASRGLEPHTTLKGALVFKTSRRSTAPALLAVSGQRRSRTPRRTALLVSLDNGFTDRRKDHRP